MLALSFFIYDAFSIFVLFFLSWSYLYLMEVKIVTYLMFIKIKAELASGEIS